MTDPEASIVLTTRDRPSWLPRAVAAALGQDFGSFEVIVVDDGSQPPVKLDAEGDRLRLVRRAEPGGVCAARNSGLEAARGRWIAFVDDDDELLPHFLSASLAALRGSALPPPVAVISAVESVDVAGRVTEVRVPPSSPRGSTFGLGLSPPGTSWYAKQTLVVPVETLRTIGGWDETFRSRSQTELLLRLNPVCSIEGLPTVTLRHVAHSEPRLSSSWEIRVDSIRRLLEKHERTFADRPSARAALLRDLARSELRLGRRRHALAALMESVRAAPAPTLRMAARRARAAARRAGRPVRASNRAD